MDFKRNIIITGGAGFIGSHVVRLFVSKYPDYRIVNVDKLTYAGNLENLRDVEREPNYAFVRADICDYERMSHLMREYRADGVIHLAAESHVDRSIRDPFTFARTNVLGTLALLEAARVYWESRGEGYHGKLFYHISTDEVYGALEMTRPQGIEPPFSTSASSGEHHSAYGEEFFSETTRYNPHSPYSASKASSDHFVRAYHDTYGMPVIVTNCSNNYGPYQFPEKLIPLFINNIRNRKPLPVYGKGENVRDWLYVEDHARAIDTIFHRGKVAETYNIGGFNEWKNIDEDGCGELQHPLHFRRRAGTGCSGIAHVIRNDRPGIYAGFGRLGSGGHRQGVPAIRQLEIVAVAPALAVVVHSGQPGSVDRITPGVFGVVRCFDLLIKSECRCRSEFYVYLKSFGSIL